jgi:hypothetical protein
MTARETTQPKGNADTPTASLPALYPVILAAASDAAVTPATSVRETRAPLSGCLLAGVGAAGSALAVASRLRVLGPFA